MHLYMSAYHSIALYVDSGSPCATVLAIRSCVVYCPFGLTVFVCVVF